MVEGTPEDEQGTGEPPRPSRRVKTGVLVTALLAVAAAWVYRPVLGYVLGMALFLILTATFMKPPPSAR